jgi:hypothetical protein
MCFSAFARRNTIKALFASGLCLVLITASAGHAVAETVIVRDSTEGKNVEKAIKFLKSIPGIRHDTYVPEGDYIDQRLTDGKISYGNVGNAETSAITGQTTLDTGVVRNNQNEKGRTTPFNDTREFESIVRLAGTLFHEMQHTRQSILLHNGGWYCQQFGIKATFEWGPWVATMGALDDWMESFLRDYQNNPSANGASLTKAKGILNVLNLVAGQFVGESASEHNYPVAPWRPFIKGIDKLKTALNGVTPGQPLSQATIDLVKSLDQSYSDALEANVNGTTGCSSTTGFYVGGELAKNTGRVHTIERLAATGLVTFESTDSGDPVGVGIVVGYTFAPGIGNILVSPFAAFDLLRQTIDHRFAGGTFFGTTTHWIGTAGVKAGVMTQWGLFAYGLAGASVLNKDLNINFGGPITSVNTTVPGATLGLGGEIRPGFLQGLGRPISVFAQYQHTWWQDAHLNQPVASPFFNYTFQREDNTLRFGFNVYLGGPSSPPPPPAPMRPFYTK